MPTFEDILDAVQYVGSDSPGMITALYDPAADAVYTYSELIGEGDIPDDLDWDTCTEIPHPNELGLGKRLVFRFVDRHLPDEADRVEYFFRKRGAYGRYKELLAEKGLLDAWYEFEAKAMQEAVKAWCAEGGIEIAGGMQPPKM